MKTIRLTDKSTIETMLRTNAYLHLYSLGDLDEFFWPRTTWYSGAGASQRDPVVLVYHGPQLPTVLALSDDAGAMRDLVRSLRDELPKRFYAHFTAGVAPALERSHRLGRLASVAGIHVYSRTYRVAALGNIATMPTHRNRGLASYTALGFEPVAGYEELLVERW